MGDSSNGDGREGGKLLRVLSWNVHFFSDRGGACNVDRVRDLLQQLDPDIVCFQEALHPHVTGQTASKLMQMEDESSSDSDDDNEVGNNEGQASDGNERWRKSRDRFRQRQQESTVLRRLCQEFDMTFYWAHCTRWQGSGFGNAVLVKKKWKVLGSHNFLLSRLNGGSRRTAQLVALDVASPDAACAQPLGICCTHLDHMNEPRRLEQWEQLQVGLKEFRTQLHEKDIPTKHLPWIICGDFNALQQGDHTPAELDYITSMRHRSGWEPPVYDVTAAVARAGYIDALKLCRDQGIGIRKEGKEDKYQETQCTVTQGSLISCWAKSRIDYIWLGPSLVSVARPSCVDSALLACSLLEDYASDHYPLACDLDTSKI